MIKTRSINGVMPVLQTPINKSGDVDEKSLKKILSFLLNKRVAGLWVLGTGSEDMNLTYEERLKVAHIVCNHINGKIPVVLGAGFFALKDIYSFIDGTSHLNFDSYHVMPYHPLLSQKRLKNFYESIANYANKPLWLYYSSNWSIELQIDLIKELKKHKNITGIKYSSKDTVKQLNIISLSEEKFQVITAVATQFFASLSLGVKGATSSIASCLPEQMQKIYNYHKKGEYTKSLNEQRKLNLFLGEIPKSLKDDNFLGAAEEKVILNYRKLCGKFTSNYYRDANSVEEKVIIKALKKYKLFKI